MIEGLLALLLCQLLGTLVVDLAHLPLPGPVLGMLLLLAWLSWRQPADDAPVMRAADRLLDVMPLLFVPAGVGVVGLLGVIRAQWLPICVGFVVPWAAGLLATAGAAALVVRLARPADVAVAAAHADQLAGAAEETEEPADGTDP